MLGKVRVFFNRDVLFEYLISFELLIEVLSLEILTDLFLMTKVYNTTLLGDHKESEEAESRWENYYHKFKKKLPVFLLPNSVEINCISGIRATFKHNIQHQSLC